MAAQGVARIRPRFGKTRILISSIMVEAPCWYKTPIPSMPSLAAREEANLQGDHLKGPIRFAINRQTRGILNASSVMFGGVRVQTRRQAVVVHLAEAVTPGAAVAQEILGAPGLSEEVAKMA